MDLKQSVISAMEELTETRLTECVRELMEQGASKAEIIQLLRQGIEKVGLHFENGEYFIADLMMSGLMFKDIIAYMESVEPTKPLRIGSGKGRILIGVIEGDIHDIGKDLVAQTLWAKGFEVEDLGVDVTLETFSRRIAASRPDILILTGVMRPDVPKMKELISILEEQRLLSDLKIIVGGCCISRSEAESMKHVSAYSVDPVETAEICENMINCSRA